MGSFDKFNCVPANLCCQINEHCISYIFHKIALDIVFIHKLFAIHCVQLTAQIELNPHIYWFYQ